MLVEDKDGPPKPQRPNPVKSKPLEHYRCGQRIAKSGRIVVPKIGWAMRFGAMSIYAGLVISILWVGWTLQDPLVMYSFIMPLSGLLNLVFGWVAYRNPAVGQIGKELVSVIVPVYNQEAMIRHVIDAIYTSTYRNFEVIVVNDGSKDKTRQILDSLARSGKYPRLSVIHQKNAGKRRAVALGFYKSRGEYLVMIDSDSIIDSNAIEEFVRTFSADERIGGVVGHIKIVNSGENLLSKIQDVWYDFSFNVGKCAESYWNSVICLSGCLAGYRRSAINHFIPYWASTQGHKAGEDKEMSMFVFAPSSFKTQLRQVFGNKFWVPASQKYMERMAQFDYAEDRALSAHAILSWKTVYVASAVGYTECPADFKKFCRQQIRWKKSFLRTNFFLNTFFWRKPMPIAFHYYLEFVSVMVAPLVMIINFVYVPLILGNPLWTLMIVGSNVVAAMMQGFDYKFRDSTSKFWYLKPISFLFTAHFLIWLVIPAVINFRKDVWGTR